jgi:hypothetical protein
MEILFSPCTRFHDILESQGRLEEFRDQPELLQELNLDVSTEQLLSAERAFTYADLYAMLGNQYMVVWLTPHASVIRGYGRGAYYWEQLDEPCSFCFSADGEAIYAFARSPEHFLEISDVILRLLAASVVVHSVFLRKRSSRNGALINAPTLAYLMELCQSLKALKLERMTLDEDHFRVLGAYSRPELDIVLESCKITTSAAASALAEVLGRNQGLTKLDSCKIDNFVLSNGLRGNSRLKSLTPSYSNFPDARNQELLAIANALRENKGLVDLNLSCCLLNDEAWGAVCDSLKTHPTLQILQLQPTQPFYGRPPLPPAVLKFRIQALVDMLKVNMSIHTIHSYGSYRHHELYRESVIPYLETNRLRPRVRAIQKTRPITYRAKVLGRALLAVRTDPNRFWMLLSGNPEVAFPKTTATPVAVTAAVSVTATRAASTAGASSAVSNIARPTS